jgi:aerotaxis receptor
MRNNQPVTQTEVALSDTSSIVSTTDLQGNITYGNAYFVEISGFTLDELLGSPQNILRHPDMPKEAFADMWATIKSGVPWTGLVKNRTKQGDFYWVLANVTPVYERGQPVGYMSVRTKPSREQVRQAEAAYKEIREGNRRGLCVLRGRVFTRPQRLLHRFDLGAQLKTAAALALGCMAMLGLQGASAAGGGALGGVLPGPGVASALAMATLGSASLLWAMWLLSQRVFAPLRYVTGGARILAGGDLSQNMEPAGEDPMGQLQNAVRQTNINLRSIIGDVRHNFEAINLATQEIATGNMDLSNRTEAQASSLEQTAASMEQLTATVSQSAGNAEQANTLASQASQVANDSGGVVARVVHTMDDINQSSRKIGDIIGVIDSIAFQTNILALNAAVEAARAGESGRGFAVVASEVRALAQRSAAAAKEIKGLIDVSLTKVNAGMALTAQAGQSMDEVIGSIGQVASVMVEITAATREQSLGIAQVNQAVGHLDTVTQQNAALVEEAAAATGNLSDQTVNLTNAIAIFKLPGDVARGGAQANVVKINRSVTADNIDLDSAVKAHADWKLKLRNAASHRETLDAGTIGRDDCCVLGKWLHGGGRSQYGKSPSFTALLQKHASFHTAAGQVAQTINNQRYEQALAMLGAGTPFASASNEVGIAIKNLRQTMNP